MLFDQIWKETVLASVIIAMLTFAMVRFVLHKKATRSVLWAAFLGYMVFLVAFTLFPLPPFGGRMSMNELFDGIVFRPIRPLLESARIAISSYREGNIYPMKIFLYNNVGNLLLLMPLALFSHRLFRFDFVPSLFFCFFFSILIESGQAAMNYFSGMHFRIVDINDIILNTTGAALFLIFLFIGEALSGFKLDKKEYLY